MLTRFRVALAAALLGVLAIAVPAQGAFYQVTFCHVEHERAWTSSEVQYTVSSIDLVYQHFGRDLVSDHGDYWGACDGHTVDTKRGKGPKS